MIEQLTDIPSNFFERTVISVIYIADAWRVQITHKGATMSDEFVDWWIANVPKANYLTFLGSSNGPTNMPLVYSGVDLLCLRKAEIALRSVSVLIPAGYEDLDVILMTFQMNGIAVPWDEINAKIDARREG